MLPAIGTKNMAGNDRARSAAQCRKNNNKPRHGAVFMSRQLA